ncbi:hypothetical protein [Anaerofustis stercorihominis]|uniref:hypothetical protein n=1 Tax=Anaerofustis stercorihominis TaxID=214853 RepID=UPI00267287DA|nr:hypothetical protein [Anaerofustis stercorihominis]
MMNVDLKQGLKEYAELKGYKVPGTNRKDLLSFFKKETNINSKTTYTEVSIWGFEKGVYCMEVTMTISEGGEEKKTRSVSERRVNINEDELKQCLLII